MFVGSVPMVDAVHRFRVAALFSVICPQRFFMDIQRSRCSGGPWAATGDGGGDGRVSKTCCPDFILIPATFFPALWRARGCRYGTAVDDSVPMEGSVHHFRVAARAPPLQGYVCWFRPDEGCGSSLPDGGAGAAATRLRLMIPYRWMVCLIVSRWRACLPKASVDGTTKSAADRITRGGLFVCNQNDIYRFYHTQPWATIASATFRKPAMLAPVT